MRKSYLDWKITQVLCYLISKIGNGKISMLPLLKIVYLADRYHLRRYGRFVTGDSYIAMRKGPAAKRTKTLIYAAEKGYGTAGAYIQSCDPKTRHANLCVEVKCGADELSETDVEALDVAIAKYNEIVAKGLDLPEYTHAFPEWQLAFAKIEPGKSYSAMNVLDFFRSPKDPTFEFCNVPADHVARMKKVFACSGAV